MIVLTHDGSTVIPFSEDGKLSDFEPSNATIWLLSLNLADPRVIDSVAEPYCTTYPKFDVSISCLMANWPHAAYISLKNSPFM